MFCLGKWGDMVLVKLLCWIAFARLWRRRPLRHVARAHGHHWATLCWNRRGTDGAFPCALWGGGWIFATIHFALCTSLHTDFDIRTTWLVLTSHHATRLHSAGWHKLMNFRCEREYVLPSSSHENVTDAFHSATSSNAFRSSYFGSSGSSGSTLALLTITSVIAVIFLRPLLFGTPATPCSASTGSKSNLHFDYIKESFWALGKRIEPTNPKFSYKSVLQSVDSPATPLLGEGSPIWEQMSKGEKWNQDVPTQQGEDHYLRSSWV